MCAKKYKAAVISCGMIANAAHIPAYKKFHSKVELMAVCDIRKETAAQTAKRHDIDFYFTDAKEMLDKIKPDIVSVCTPNAYHKDLSIMALESGAHVICEKPIAVTLKNAVEMLDTAKKAGKYLIAAQTSRFGTEAMAAKNMISNNILGDIYFADLTMIRRRGIPKWGTFHMKSHNEGGPFCDLGVHVLDTFLWLAKNPKAISVFGMDDTRIANNENELISSENESGAFAGVFSPRQYNADEYSVEDAAFGSIRFEGNILANFKYAWALNLPDEYSIKIAGSKGGICLPGSKIYSNLGSFQADIIPKIPKGLYDNMNFSGHYYLIEHAIDVIDGKCELTIKPEEILNLTACIEAFYMSAEKKREIRTEELSLA